MQIYTTKKLKPLESFSPISLHSSLESIRRKVLLMALSPFAQANNIYPFCLKRLILTIERKATQHLRWTKRQAEKGVVGSSQSAATISF